MDKENILKDPFISKINKYILKNNLISKNDTILCAVSGGPDSVALLYILYLLMENYSIDLYVAHLEHGIRGKESIRDQEFVAALCKEFNIPFYTRNVNIIELKKGGECIEEVAREVRLNFLREMCKSLNCNKIALGHTFDDHIETIIFRLINGTGQKGIMGIRYSINEIIRPLLGVTKREILEFLKRNSIVYMQDKTNYDIKYTRNRIRYRIIPEMEKINRRYREHINNFVELIAEDNSFIEGILKDYIEKVVKEVKESEIRILSNPFYELHQSIKKRIILWSISNLYKKEKNNSTYLSFKTIKEITKKKPESNKTLYKNKFITILSEYGELAIKKSVVENTNTEYLYTVNRGDKEVFIKEIGKKIIFNIVEKQKLDRFELGKLYLDLEKIDYPLKIRGRKKGDKINLPNLGLKKIKSIFINDKVKPLERSLVPIILIKGKIAGIFCNYYGKPNRIAKDFMVDKKTKKILVCSME